MRIYTKSGDKGETGLIGGTRVSKTDARICAIGEVDELNASIGVLRTHCVGTDPDPLFYQIQNDLFAIGAELAGGKTTIQESHVKKLENAIDELEEKLPQLKNFILPGGTPFAAQAHLTRAVCRRAERSAVLLNQVAPLNNQTLIYLNRLSDLLFMLAREEMYNKEKEETIWKSNP